MTGWPRKSERLTIWSGVLWRENSGAFVPACKGAIVVSLGVFAGSVRGGWWHVSRCLRLHHRELSRPGPSREGVVDPRELLPRQPEIPGPRVLCRVLRMRGLGNGEDRGPAHQEAKRDLPRRRAVGGGDCRQDPASLA